MVQDRKIATRVRLADVAAEAGVSSMTVSEILRPRNSRIQVSEKTRLRVLEAVKRLNYQPNLQARSLADGRSSLVGILFSSLQDPFFAELLNHLEQELRRHNLTGIYAFWSDYEHFEQALNTVICNNVCGIVTSHDELGERVPDSIPTVVYGYPHEKYDSIYPDWEEIMKMIFRHLYERGYRKFGYAGHWATRKTRQDILKKILKDENLPVRADWFYSDRNVQDVGMAAARKFLKQKERPEVIIAQNDFTAMSLMSNLQMEGDGIPEDVAVTGIDNLFIRTRLAPNLTTVDLDIPAIAKNLSALLIERLREPAAPHREITTESHLITGKSC